ncbi:MAG: hypothetical protein KBF96_07590 [Ignavibacteria bacterium]|nr:hypothetical protein [Ignavibacteria bacterium]
MIISLVLIVSGFILISNLDLDYLAIPLITGWFVCFINVLIGSLIITKAFKSQGKGFFNTVLLSMVVRMFAIAGLVFILVYFLKFDRIGFPVILFIFYFLFLILEINYLSGNTYIKQNTQNN